MSSPSSARCSQRTPLSARTRRSQRISLRTPPKPPRTPAKPSTPATKPLTPLANLPYQRPRTSKQLSTSSSSSSDEVVRMCTSQRSTRVPASSQLPLKPTRLLSDECSQLLEAKFVSRLRTPPKPPSRRSKPSTPATKPPTPPAKLPYQRPRSSKQLSISYSSSSSTSSEEAVRKSTLQRSPPQLPLKPSRPSSDERSKLPKAQVISRLLTPPTPSRQSTPSMFDLEPPSPSAKLPYRRPSTPKKLSSSSSEEVVRMSTSQRSKHVGASPQLPLKPSRSSSEEFSGLPKAKVVCRIRASSKRQKPPESSSESDNSDSITFRAVWRQRQIMSASARFCTKLREKQFCQPPVLLKPKGEPAEPRDQKQAPGTLATAGSSGLQSKPPGTSVALQSVKPSLPSTTAPLAATETAAARRRAKQQAAGQTGQPPPGNELVKSVPCPLDPTSGALAVPAPPLPPPPPPPQFPEEIRFRCDYDCTIRDVLADRGWKQVEGEDSTWNVFWCEVTQIRETLDGTRLSEHQLLPHFRNHYELTRKNLLYRNMKRLRRLYMQNNYPLEAKICDCVPCTFEIPDQYMMFLDEYHKNPEETWIAKPAMGCQGRGIFIFRSFDDLVETFLSTDEEEEGESEETQTTLDEDGEKEERKDPNEEDKPEENVATAPLDASDASTDSWTSVSSDEWEEDSPSKAAPPEVGPSAPSLSDDAASVVSIDSKASHNSGTSKASETWKDSKNSLDSRDSDWSDETETTDLHSSEYLSGDSDEMGLEELAEVIEFSTESSEEGSVRRSAESADDSDEENPLEELYVVQKYIESPYLIGGRKFDLRLYVLVTSFYPLRVWTAREGFARFSAGQYSLDDMDNQHVHITNTAMQRTSSAEAIDVSN